MTSELDPRDTSSDTPLASDPLAQAARRAHAASLDRLSPRVQAQLAQRRRAALSPRATVARGWPWLAAASAATLAVVIGVFVIRDGLNEAPSAQVATGPSIAPSPTVTATPAGTTPAETLPPADVAAAHAFVPPAPADTSIDAAMAASISDNLIAAEFDTETVNTGIDYDALDESPDFYEWLGSEDAQLDAPEL